MISQLLFNSLLKFTGKASILKKVLMLCRSIRLTLGDPEIIYRYGKSQIRLPLSHDLPLNRAQYPSYNRNLGLIAKCISLKYSDLKVIDVGANVGDSVAFIHEEVDVPVLCIEGNPRFLPLLEKNVMHLKNVEIEAAFVGETEMRVAANNNLGTAYLTEDQTGVRVEPMTSVLSRHPQFAGAKLLKVDTDGFDNKIIRGSAQILKNAKPVIFFEYDPYFLRIQKEEDGSIFPFLESLQYKTLIIFDNVGRKLITLPTTDRRSLQSLHSYFDRSGTAYMDICAIHESDEDLVSKIESEFA
jgi:FkbM family methyltransferase